MNPNNPNNNNNNDSSSAESNINLNDFKISRKSSRNTTTKIKNKNRTKTGNNTSAFSERGNATSNTYSRSSSKMTMNSLSTEGTVENGENEIRLHRRFVQTEIGVDCDDDKDNIQGQSKERQREEIDPRTSSVSSLSYSSSPSDSSISSKRAPTFVKEEIAIQAIKLSTKNKHAATLEKLYQDHPGLQDFNFKGGSTPLIEAVIACQTEIVKVLLAAKVPVNYVGNKEVYCALYQALNQETEEAVTIVSILIEAGANIHLKMKNGVTCMDWARIARKESPVHGEMFTILKKVHEEHHREEQEKIKKGVSFTSLGVMDVHQEVTDLSLRKFLLHFKLDQYLELLYSNYGITSIKHFVEADWTWQPCALGPEQYWAINLDELYVEDCLHQLTISSSIQKEVGLSALDINIIKRNLKRKLRAREKEERQRLGFLFLLYRRSNCRFIFC